MSDHSGGMICPNCESTNPDNARFCIKCGTVLAKHCAHCLSELPPTAVFCPNCGRPVKGVSGEDKRPHEKGGPGADRRPVTILFADVVGFTALSEQLDPEEVREFMNRCFDRLVPAITKYGGTIDKFIGDEIMALFGAPMAHEDDPVRALRAALEMGEHISQFNQDNGTNLGLHIGVNTGLVVAGGVGSRGQEQYTVMGDPVNLASRLEGISGPSEILVGQDTYRLTAPIFDFEPLAPQAIKGKEDAVVVYRLLGSRDQPGVLRGLVGLESPLIGRDAELDKLLQLVEDVRAGSSQVILILGEPGVGKSRLVAEWRQATAQLSGNPLSWTEGHCLSFGRGLPYHLVIDVLRSLLAILSSADKGDVEAALRELTDRLFGQESRQIYPFLAHLLSLELKGDAARQVSSIDARSLRSLYRVAWRRLWRLLAQERPQVLVLEDIHWADPSSTAMMVDLLSLLKETPLLLCLTARPELKAPGWRLVTSVHEQVTDDLTEFDLTGLSGDQSREMLDHLLHKEPLPDDLLSLILGRAEGNPLFVEEVIRMLLDRGAIVRRDGQWQAAGNINSADIPETLQGLLLSRIDRLPDETRHTLRVASVIGRQFSASLLEKVLGGL